MPARGALDRSSGSPLALADSLAAAGSPVFAAAPALTAPTLDVAFLLLSLGARVAPTAPCSSVADPGNSRPSAISLGADDFSCADLEGAGADDSGR